MSVNHIIEILNMRDLFSINEEPIVPTESTETTSDNEESTEPASENEESAESAESDARDWKYPPIEKMKGTIAKTKDMFMVSFDYGQQKVRQLYRKKSDARQTLLGLNISHQTAKNRYYYEDDFIVYEITHKGQKFYGKLDLDKEEFLNKHLIYMIPGGYACARVNGKTKYVHHVVCQPAEGMVCDHKNRDKLDNRARNLRACTYRSNSLNREASGNLIKRKCGNLYTITFTNDDGVLKQAWFPVDAEDPNGEAEAKARAIRWREKKQRKSLGIW